MGITSRPTATRGALKKSCPLTSCREPLGGGVDGHGVRIEARIRALNAFLDTFIVSVGSYEGIIPGSDRRLVPANTAPVPWELKPPAGACLVSQFKRARICA